MCIIILIPLLMRSGRLVRCTGVSPGSDSIFPYVRRLVLQVWHLEPEIISLVVDIIQGSLEGIL